MISDWLDSWMCGQSRVHGYRGTKDTGLTTNYTWISTSRRVGTPNSYAVNGELYTETSIQKSLFILKKGKKNLPLPSGTHAQVPPDIKPTHVTEPNLPTKRREQKQEGLQP